MASLPVQVNSVEQLDDMLSTPSDKLIEEMKQLDGDLMVLGAGGKIGPSLTRRAKRAVDSAGVSKDVFAVDIMALPELEEAGVKTITCDMLDLKAVEGLPRAKNIVFMAGRKFGSTGQESFTWAINVIVPYHVARTFTDARIAAFSTGCVYPVMHIYTGGPTEATPPEPVGEYAMSSLGRERVFEHASTTYGEEVAIVRLNYAVELRYGVLFDIGTKVYNGEPVDLTTGFANVIWQGDACDQVLRSLALAQTPANVLNVTGPETFSVRKTAQKFGRLFGKEVVFQGEENGMGYLNDASEATRIFGYPSVPLDQIIEWTAHWIDGGGESLGKPTHFETQDGKY